MKGPIHSNVSAVIAVWNGEEHLAACLEALLAQKGVELEVIAVDNGSSDGSTALLRQRYPAVRLIENGRNLGYAGGCNVGLRAARGQVLLVLNQDAVVRPGWAAALCAALQEPSTGVVGCKLLYPDGRVQHAGGILRWPRAEADHWGHGQADDGRWDAPREPDYVSGAAWGMRRDTFERVGGLDEGFWPGYYEDGDYCLRVRQAGLRVLYVPQAVAVHAESTSLGGRSAAYLEAFHRGRLRLALKHLAPEQFLDAFVPAEREWLAGPVARDERLALTRVYRAALQMLPRLYAAQAWPLFQAVAAAIQQLGLGVWREADEMVG